MPAANTARGLAGRLGDDLPLLSGLLNVYCWLCPGDALKVPPRLREMLPHCETNGAERLDKSHMNFLDTRPWFIAAQKRS